MLFRSDEIAVPGLFVRFHATDETVTIVVGAQEATSSTRSFLFADLRGYTAFTERHGDAAARDLVAE